MGWKDLELCNTQVVIDNFLQVCLSLFGYLVGWMEARLTQKQLNGFLRSTEERCGMGSWTKKELNIDTQPDK